MSCGTVFSQIQIESVILLFESQLFHTPGELLIVILSLASADDLSDARYKAVYCGNGLPIVVLLHVERLDLLRIIRNEYRALVDLFCQITLMLCLEITSP